MNEEPARGAGIAVLVIPMPGGMAAPTDTFPAERHQSSLGSCQRRPG